MKKQVSKPTGSSTLITGTRVIATKEEGMGYTVKKEKENKYKNCLQNLAGEIKSSTREACSKTQLCLKSTIELMVLCPPPGYTGYGR